jgi:hypothetical protein
MFKEFAMRGLRDVPGDPRHEPDEEKGQVELLLDSG